MATGPRWITWSSLAHDKLAGRGMTVDDAIDVFRGTPVFRRQKADYEELEDGSVRWRQERLVMIGPDRGGRMLVFVLTVPNDYLESRIATGWPATDGQVALYNQVKRRR